MACVARYCAPDRRRPGKGRASASWPSAAAFPHLRDVAIVVVIMIVVVAILVAVLVDADTAGTAAADSGADRRGVAAAADHCDRRDLRDEDQVALGVGCDRVRA